MSFAMWMAKQKLVGLEGVEPSPRGLKVRCAAIDTTDPMFTGIRVLFLPMHVDLLWVCGLKVDRVGLEPTHNRLRVCCSATELPIHFPSPTTEVNGQCCGGIEPPTHQVRDTGIEPVCWDACVPKTTYSYH